MSCNCTKNKKQSPIKSKKNANIKVINGITVNYQKYPFFGVIWNEDFVTCGASLIKKGDESIVITAAHCVDFAIASDLQVGFYQPDRITKKYIYNVTKIQIHPGWNPKTLDNDIALLTIAGNPPSEVPVLAIPSKVLGKKFIIPGTNTKVIGYGLTENNETAFYLQCGCSPIVSKNNPQNLWDDIRKNKKDIIFAGQSFSNPTQNVNICIGDSGGPLLYVYNGVTYLVGLASFVFPKGCATYGYPGGYANVNYFREWITINAGV
jgi:secreted trypsin-like serine protease